MLNRLSRASLSVGHHFVYGPEAEFGHDLAQSAAMNRMKLTRGRDCREEFAELRILVATPTGQVFKWHTRIIRQPASRAARWQNQIPPPEQRGDGHVAAVLSWPSAST